MRIRESITYDKVNVGTFISSLNANFINHYLYLRDVCKINVKEYVLIYYFRKYGNLSAYMFIKEIESEKKYEYRFVQCSNIDTYRENISEIILYDNTFPFPLSEYNALFY